MIEPMSQIKIACRKSPLAQLQADLLSQALHQSAQKILCDSQLDLNQHQSVRELPRELQSFTKEVDQLVLTGEVDLGCHSAKDMGLEISPDLDLLCHLQRDEPNDAWIGPSPEALPAGAVVGTDSPRRMKLIEYHYPHLRVRSIRGNIGTRLSKWRAGEYQAIMMAKCALSRMEIEVEHIVLPTDQFVPAMNQGIILTTICKRHRDFSDYFSAQHTATRQQLLQERAVGRALNLSCSQPVGVYTNQEGKTHVYLGEHQKWFVHDPSSDGLIETWVNEVVM